LDPQGEPARLRSCLARMWLESFGVAVREDLLGALMVDLGAIADLFRAKARRERIKGEVRSALRLERRAWALDIYKVHGLDVDRLIGTVDFNEGYEGKILMVRITGKYIPGMGRLCLRSGDDWHHEILRNTEMEIMDLGFETAVTTPLGGAHIRFEAGGAMLFGSSDTYGACDKRLAAQLISAAFPRLQVMTD
jgi:hypothetical protein